MTRPVVCAPVALWLAAAAEAWGAAPGDRLPDLVLTDRAGEDVRLEDGRVAVVNLWASWCGPCREELPRLDALAARVPEARVVFVSVDTAEGRARALADHLRLSAPVWFRGAPLAAALEPGTLPATYVLDASGTVRHVNLGALDAAGVAGLESQVRALLAEPR